MNQYINFLSSLVLCISLFCIGCASAQVNNESDSNLPNTDVEVESEEQDSFFFAYAKSEGNSILGMVNTEGVPDYKYKTVKKVLDRLIMARGDKRSQKPKLILSEKEKYVAYMNSRTIEIGLENKAYDICASMGADSLNAIAVLLGHEIVHYYEKHNWTNNFAKKNMAMETGQNLKKIAKVEGLPNETQADYLGGFLGYSAGFNTLGMMPKVLKKLYAGYGLPNDISGYPTLGEREQISNNSMALLEELMHVFDMANYLTVIGDYKNARIHYKRVLKDFQSREIYNNVGVISFLEALELFEAKELKYGYPIELDAESRLAIGTRGSLGFADIKEKREGLLREAIEHFDQAVILDKEYAIGYLNLACAHSLLGESDEAELFATRAKRYAKQQASKSTQADVLIIQGIVAGQLDDKETSKEKFQKAVEMGSSLAATNLKILNGEEIVFTPNKSFGINSEFERIDDIVLTSFLKDPKINPDNGDKTIEVERGYQLYVIKNNGSKIYLAFNETEKSHSSVLITNPDYTGTTTNFKVALGDEITKVSKKENFGYTAQTVGSNQGRYFIYPKKNLFFLADADNKVSRWAVFNIHVPE